MDTSFTIERQCSFAFRDQAVRISRQIDRAEITGVLFGLFGDPLRSAIEKAIQQPNPSMIDRKTTPLRIIRISTSTSVEAGSPFPAIRSRGRFPDPVRAARLRAQRASGCHRR